MMRRESELKREIYKDREREGERGGVIENRKRDIVDMVRKQRRAKFSFDGETEIWLILRFSYPIFVTGDMLHKIKNVINIIFIIMI